MTVRISPSARVLFRTLVSGLSVVLGAQSLSAQTQAAESQPYQAPVELDTAALKGPVQPIFFRHDLHAGQYQLDCRYCHYTAEYAAQPGIPPLETCMGCHRITAAAKPEVQKLREAYQANEPIEWIKAHDLPRFVHFPHMRHVAAGVECQTCHGQIERMARVYQYSSLKMGWCLTCHDQRGVTTDCLACHY